MTPDNSDTVVMAQLIRLLSVRLTPRGGEPLDVAIDAPAGFDGEGQYIDLGPCLREAFGGGVLASEGAVVELRVRWVPPPPDEDE